MNDVVSVCSDCGRELVRVHPDVPGLTTFQCPVHGERGFHLNVGRVCAECYELIEEDEAVVPSRAIEGAPLVHEECAG